MRRVLALVAVAIVAAFVVSGCGNGSVENKYEDGRADQKAKADKMIEDNSE